MSEQKPDIGVVLVNSLLFGFEGSGLKLAVIDATSALTGELIRTSRLINAGLISFMPFSFFTVLILQMNQPAASALYVASANESGVHRKSPIINTSLSMRALSGSSRNLHSN